MEKVISDILNCLEGGEKHLRQKLKTSNSAKLDDFLRIGQILKACANTPTLVDRLLERLVEHQDVMLGALPRGVLSFGPISDSEYKTTSECLLESLNDISEQNLRQWVIDDSSLIYGELGKEELEIYFKEVNRLVKHRDQFIDLGSGLGKVVMTASISIPFSSYVGIELMPYRQKLALEQYSKFSQAIASEADKLKEIGQVALNSQLQHPTCGYSHVIGASSKIELRLGDLLSCDIRCASLIFIYSTCFGSFMHKIADKVAKEAPEGCLVSATTYQFDHPGLRLLEHYPSKEMAWTDVRIYERVGVGPGPESNPPAPRHFDNAVWKSKAFNILRVAQ